ncbi:HlyD family type I secretion periplasmic adaptor subunit [Roseobacter sp. YSTF-M11]|uniref:Membrane fusion protein (MFP) family protein n=1 Tax=Roseobacter insulae TaxID=2859783 RepID=A0A9X1FY14_9RHOB|nr:HlyD family type I secretion periplasmic adaptor subunit [Roseobacter insulae]MBW4709120.1 HlyD family type I secretion periplasmic adaptor subunit [Roseobacter insulae]
MNEQDVKTTWSAQKPLAIGFAALLLLVGVVGIWSTQTEIAAAVVAEGMVEVESNRQIIQHPEGGVVGEILVKNDDHVAAGDVLIRLDGRLLRSELTVVQAQLHELLVRKARLQAERDDLPQIEIGTDLAALAQAFPDVADLIQGQMNLFRARAVSLEKEMAQLAEQVDQIGNEILGTEAQLAALEEQQQLVTDEKNSAEELLSKGLMQASRVTTLRRDAAGITGELGRLAARKAQLNGQIAALNIEKLRLKTTRREEAISALRDLQPQEVELTERALSLRETLSRLDIRTPVSGIVYGNTVFALQSVIQPAAPIMYVVPQDQPLVVSARIPSSNIDQVFVGQETSLRFTSFSQRTTPAISGEVSNLSADVFSDETTGNSYYRARIKPNMHELAKLQGQELLPGMPVQLFIKSEERTPLSFLVKPLMDYLNRAFREA